MTNVLDIQRSILGQPWRWRALADDARAGFAPDDLVTQLLLARGCSRDVLDAHKAPSIRGFMPDPSIFRDMDKAAARIADAVIAGEHVAVFGDYDVDGATSAALLILLLRDLGIEARAYIPDRVTEGYGPTETALALLANEGATLIVTVDCGAQAFAALDSARVDVIVVDHHQCASELPRAHAVVNPNRLDEGEGAAHGHLAAVGVAFLLGAALVRTLRVRGWFETRAEPKLIDLLDIVALGTVADVVPLTGLNRAFVAQGLKVMAVRRNLGLNALIDVAKIERAPTAHDLGFALGPRINAGGRVGKSDLGVRLLTATDPDEAAALAAELDRLNGERRAIEAEVTEEALARAGATANSAVAVVAGSGWHPGVIGIVASRLKDRVHKPAIVIALQDDGTAKGSGRSLPGVDLGGAILAAKDHGLLIAGGGHAMAAGLTVETARIAALTEFLNDRLGSDVSRAQSVSALALDAALAPAGVNVALADALDAAGPYGQGWAHPRVASGPWTIVKCDIVGENHVRTILSGADGSRLKAMAFRSADSPLGVALVSAGKRPLFVAGRVRRDDWGRTPAAELHLDDMAFAD